MSLRVLERPDVLANGSSAAEPFQSSPRARLKSQLELLAQARARVADLAQVRDAAFAAAADEGQAQTALDGIAVAEQADVQRWIADGASGPAPGPRADERTQAQARLAQARAIRAARSHAWVQVEPKFGEAIAELERLAKERGEFVGAVLLEVANEIVRGYCDAVKTAMVCERQLAAIRRACFELGAQAAGSEITELLRLGTRSNYDQRLVSRAEVQQTEKQVRTFVEMLCANPNVVIEDAAL